MQSSFCVSKVPRCNLLKGRSTPACRTQKVVAFASKCNENAENRRNMLQKLAMGITSLSLTSQVVPAFADSLPQEAVKMICDANCVAGLDSVEFVTLPSGLKYRDIKVGQGPEPPVGYQVVLNYVAMMPSGRVFGSSLEQGSAYTIRVGAGQVIEGLDEGLRSMKTGGIRRLYIPGNLSFPNGIKAAAGRPSVPPKSDVVFDVQLLYIPGLELDDE